MTPTNSTNQMHDVAVTGVSRVLIQLALVYHNNSLLTSIKHLRKFYAA